MRQHILNHLEANDGRPELNSLRGIFKGQIKGPLGHSDGGYGIDDPLPVKTAHQNPNTFVLFSQEIFRRDFTVFKDQLTRWRAPHPHLLQGLSSGKPGEPFLHNKGGYPVLTSLRIGLGIYDHHIGQGSVCNKHLGTVQDIPVPFFSAGS